MTIVLLLTGLHALALQHGSRVGGVMLSYVQSQDGVRCTHNDTHNCRPFATQHHKPMLLSYTRSSVYHGRASQRPPTFQR